jgi:hypothetical protein
MDLLEQTAVAVALLSLLVGKRHGLVPFAGASCLGSGHMVSAARKGRLYSKPRYVVL